MTSTEPNQGYVASRGYAWYVFALLFLVYMFDYIDRLIVVSLFPFLQKDWGLTDTQCGALVSAVYWAIVVFTFPVSLLIDRWSRKKVIGIMAVSWSLATLACAFTRNFSQLFVARTAIGIGEAGYAPGGTAMISALFPQKQRSMVMGLWNASIPLGSALGMAIGGLVAEHYGWRHAFGLVAIPGMIVSLLFFGVRDYKTVALTPSTPAKGSASTNAGQGFAVIARRFLATPSLILTYFAFVGNTFLTSSLLTWMATYFHRVDNIPMSQAGIKGSLVLFLAIVGAPLGGYLTDRWMKKRMDARLLFPALSSLLTAVIFFVAFYFFTGKTQYILMLAGGITCSAFVPAAAAVTQDVVHPGLRAISYSLCVIFQNILGSSLGPIFVGFISDRYDIKTALTLVPIATLVAALLYYLASFHYERDLARVEKVALEAER
jgi:MFS family permease